MTHASTLKQGGFIRLCRGHEWIVIQPMPEYDENNECADWSTTRVVWLYGHHGCVGGDRCICDMAVLDSQLQAHLEHGWEFELRTHDKL
jgi:hypothetical protein